MAAPVNCWFEKVQLQCTKFKTQVTEVIGRHCLNSYPAMFSNIKVKKNEKVSIFKL